MAEREAGNEQRLPTDAELRVLRVLWDKGPSTVHDVHEAVGAAAVGYTTVLKTLQVMYDKGLVDRERLSRYTRAHVYKPVVTRDDMEKSLVGDLAVRAFGGAIPRLVLQALSSTETTPEEIAKIRDLLDRLEREGA